MKKILLVILLFFVSVCASELNKNKFVKLSNDYYAVTHPVFDFNRQYCTIIKIEYNNCQMITLNQKIFKKKIINNNECYFYISHNEDKITFNVDNHESITLNAPKNGFIMGVVYYIKLELDKIQE